MPFINQAPEDYFLTKNVYCIGLCHGAKDCKGRKFPTFDEASKACNNDPRCWAINNRACDAKNEYEICIELKKYSVIPSTQVGSCIYEKRNSSYRYFQPLKIVISSILII